MTGARVLAQVPATPGLRLTLAGSADLLAVHELAETCPCTPDGSQTVHADALLVAAPGGPLQCIAGFTKTSRCGGRPPCSEPRVDGAVLAYARCTVGATRIVDLTHGAQAPVSRVVPLGGVDIAGEWAAGVRREGDRTEIVVERWRDGVETLALPDATNEDEVLDVTSDGVVMFLGPIVDHALGGRDVMWASPADPTAHRVVRVEATQPVRAARGLVAVMTRRGYAIGGPATIDVFDRSGEAVARVAEPALAADPLTGLNWDFDGARIAYLSQPCLIRTLVVTDLGGPVPSHLAGRCAAARISGPVRRIGRRLRVFAKCVDPTHMGCQGSVRLIAHTGRRIGRRTAYLLGDGYLQLLPGRLTVLRVAVGRGGRRWLRRHPRARVRAVSAATGSFSVDERPDVRVTELALEHR
jgi:hypothetical protein